MLQKVEWGEFRLGDLFDVRSNPQLNKDSFIFNENGEYPYFTRTVFNNGILGYVDYLDEEHKIEGNCLAVGMLGMQFFYMEKDFYAGQFTKSIIPKGFSLTKNTAKFLVSILNRFQKSFQNVLVRYFESTFNKTKIVLPVKHGEIDFDFMENFIALIERENMNELDLYLSASGLNDWNLTNKELMAIHDFEKGLVNFDGFSFDNIFNKIAQGRRLKKEDQRPGKIPFVMSGVANTGVVNYVSNPVASFPQNSITIDIFGNTFYRGYDFGAGDDTGVYWNNEKNYSKNLMMFFATAMSKSVNGKYSYGHKLRSSQSLKFKMMLPSDNGSPNVELMETLISAIKKLVIKDVILYIRKENLAEK